MQQKTITEQHRKTYQDAINQHNNGLHAMHWPFYKPAARRYKELLVDIELEKRSILDVGCGLGNLLPYIASKSNNFTYHGIDIMPEFIAQAQASYPEFNFSVADFWSDDFQEKADIVLTSGTLNFAILDIEQRKKMIKKLFDQSNSATVFNMSGQHPVSKDISSKGLIRYVDALEIFNYCFSLTKKIVFRHHYHKYDFTIAMFHQKRK
ncbi:MAG: class I SAM-dependent methyltransferase [Candidatus Abawacabacteria bacterium]|nr:class I SAM-dependent methyltransferase [Candidatus Abawacabacteria bacterium]